MGDQKCVLSTRKKTNYEKIDRVAYKEKKLNEKINRTTYSNSSQLNEKLK